MEGLVQPGQSVYVDDHGGIWSADGAPRPARWDFVLDAHGRVVHVPISGQPLSQTPYARVPDLLAEG